MRIAIACISHESSTFSLHRILAADFLVLRGDDLLDAVDPAAVLGADTAASIDWLPVLRATATPGGPIDASAWDAFEDEIAAALEGADLDGVYLFLHGAVYVDGRDGAEERLVRRIRDTVGAGVVLSASMDTHGNLSAELAGLLDLASVHRHAPHIDIPETHARALRGLVQVLQRGERPVRAHVSIPVLLPGERTSTLVEPGLSVFGGLTASMQRWDVIDAGLWVGFFWADEPRVGAAAFVSGWDADAVRECAAHLARAYWDARDRFDIVSDHHGSWTEGLDFALTRPAAPLYLSDAGDNVSAGASGDLTFALHATLARDDVVSSGLRMLFTGLVDPASVDAAVAVGEGGVLERAIGATVDTRYGDPVPGPWRVDRLIEGLRHDGQEGVTGALLRRDALRVIVQRERAYFIEPDDAAFASVRLRGLAWVDPGEFDVVVVKNGYLFPGQAARAATWFMALTPGGTDLDPHRLDFRRIRRPLFPFDEGFAPDLTPRVLAPLGSDRKDTE